VTHVTFLDSENNPGRPMTMRELDDQLTEATLRLAKAIRTCMTSNRDDCADVKFYALRWIETAATACEGAARGEYWGE
jgi:5,10-methylenetetrahydrofolate reductase